MNLLNKYRQKNNYKTFASINNEGHYYRFLAKWQDNTRLTSTKLLKYTEDANTDSLYIAIKTKIGNNCYLIEVSCKGKEVSFAIICKATTNINLLLKEGFLHV